MAEYIGIKSTRLRSVAGEQIVKPNSELLRNPLHNFGRMAERRVVFSFNVQYETPRARLERLLPTVRDIVESHADVRFDRCHLAALEQSALRIETVYFVTLADYNRHMDLQQSIYLGLLEGLERLGIQVAYPVWRVWPPPPGPAGGQGV